MSEIVVAVLVPPIHPKSPKAHSFPITKAIQNLNCDGIKTVFGFKIYRDNNTVRINGKTIYKNDFIDISCTINIIHDRFPSQIRSSHFLDIQSIATDIPFGNPFSTTLLCRDKLACQRLLENNTLNIPEVIAVPSQFDTALRRWGLGFIKPQFGALGQGVQAVTPPMRIPPSLPGVVPNRLEPTILQRGISPPVGWAGMSVRQLMQKEVGGSWIARTAVLRRSKDESVVNVARGAQAVPAIDFLPSDTIQEIERQSFVTCSILDKESDGQYNVELGLDFVIDPDYQPWLIEVNSRPRGRLETLAIHDPDRFLIEHQSACVQPIRYLASLCR